LLGGINSADAATSVVYTAPINADGTLGTWAAGTSLPAALGVSQAIVTKSRVYLLGGLNSAGASVSTVYTAPINVNGTLGAWTTGTPLPVAIRGGQAFVTNSRVYYCGGLTTATVATVYTAPINADGTLGAWTTSTPLPSAQRQQQSLVTNSHVFLIGSYDGVGVNVMHIAPINADGTLGAWVVGGTIGANLGNSSLIATSSSVYCIGGLSTTPVTTVMRANFAGGANDYTAPSYTHIPSPATSGSFTLPLIPNASDGGTGTLFSLIKT
jgi:hypothetical protein